MKKLFTLITTIMLITGVVFPAYASQPVDVPQQQGLSHLSKADKQTILRHLSEINIDKARNNKDLSKKKKEIINKVIANQKKYLSYADINEGNTVIILNTEESNTQVAITNDIVEVVEQVDANTFLINDEKHHFEYSFTTEESNQAALGEVEIQSSDGWIKVSSRKGPWSFISGKWVNVNAQRDFHTYSAGAFGSILATIMATGLGIPVAGGVALGIGVSSAYAYVASTNTPTNVGKSYVSEFRNGTTIFADKRIWSSDYVVYKAKDIHLGITETFYYRCVGCGGAL
ncbi:hypothetical protein J27TS8_39930 [Robertmurraya siralis]|uniref:Uncharacterized protein n=1 Tax=Robertmurraya siralis TaxID=77777 RepID=A0A919WL52_9BACI|nr:hypothetical protein [Robertmurraya siralis]GIN64000.1 hypothetical protein J27TS8_39930 [Robertmurraya siralis]